MKSHDTKRDKTKEILKNNDIKFKRLCGLGYSSRPFANFYANNFDKQKLVTLFKDIIIMEISNNTIECSVY